MAILLIQAVFEFLAFLSRGHSNESPRNDEKFSFFVWKLWPFEVEIPVRAIFTIIITDSVQLILLSSDIHGA